MAMRRPTGESGVGSGLRWASARSALSRLVLRRFTRRSTGARSASALPSSAADAPKLASSCGASHSGKSPTTCAGAPRKVRGRKPLAFGFGELRRRVALAGEQSGDRLGVEVLGLSERAQHFGARSRFAHDPGGGAFLAQRVVDEARDRGAIARAREAVRQAPIFHRVGRGSATGFDIRQNFDRCGGAGGGDHGEGNLWGLKSRFISPVGAGTYISPRRQCRARRWSLASEGTRRVSRTWSADRRPRPVRGFP